MALSQRFWGCCRHQIVPLSLYFCQIYFRKKSKLSGNGVCKFAVLLQYAFLPLKEKQNIRHDLQAYKQLCVYSTVMTSCKKNILFIGSFSFCCILEKSLSFSGNQACPRSSPDIVYSYKIQKAVLLQGNWIELHCVHTLSVKTRKNGKHLVLKQLFLSWWQSKTLLRGVETSLNVWRFVLFSLPSERLIVDNHSKPAWGAFIQYPPPLLTVSATYFPMR